MGSVEAPHFFMKNKNLLKDTRKTYQKIIKLLNKNAINGMGNCLFYYRLLRVRRIILKWYLRNNASLIMTNMTKLDYALNYGMKNHMDYKSDGNISHILKLSEDFIQMSVEIEDYYNE